MCELAEAVSVNAKRPDLWTSAARTNQGVKGSGHCLPFHLTSGAPRGTPPMSGRDNLRPAPPFQPGNTAAVTHGAQSRRVATRASVEKRRLLRALGLRQGDLGPIGRGLLDNYARIRSKLLLLDLYFEEKGMLDSRGNPRGATKQSGSA